MTTLIDMRATGSAPEPDDRPRAISKSLSVADRVFRWGSTGIGTMVMVVTGAIGVFLGLQMIPTLRHYGLRFFTENQWNPELNIVGISEVLLGTVEVALIALVFAFPLALGTALYISEYSPAWLRAFLVSMVDLMAAIPSIIYGVWGVFLIRPHALYVALDQRIFRLDSALPASRAAIRARRYSRSASTSSSPFIAGMVVSMMVIPLACAVMRACSRRRRIGEREGAYALGRPGGAWSGRSCCRSAAVASSAARCWPWAGRWARRSPFCSSWPRHRHQVRPLENGGVTTSR